MKPFCEKCDANGNITFPQFEECFKEIFPQDLPSELSDALQILLTELFFLFDTDGNGLVDYEEFITGMLVVSPSNSIDTLHTQLSLL